MKRMLLFLLVTFVVPVTLWAAQIPAAEINQPIVPGQWHKSLDKALAMGEAEGIPVIVFWSSPTCTKCDTVINNAINTPEFTKWREDRGVLLVVGEGSVKGSEGKKIYDWVKKATSSDGGNSYPYIRVYWQKRDGTLKADYRFSAYAYRVHLSMINQLERFIGDFNTAGRAEFATTPGLEAEPSTSVIPLPLVRVDGSDGELVNQVEFTQTLEGGTTTNWSSEVVWGDGEIKRNLIVPIDNHQVGGVVTVALKAEDEDDQSVTIKMVEEVPVSVFNPRFVGEEFEVGEWSMDFVAATNKTANYAGEAFTLVFFTGTLWCPYCLGIEKDILDSAEFLEFARTNNINLVEIDNYRRDTKPPSLLRYAVYNGAANDQRNGASGAGYLSRHGIDVERAEALQEFNLALQLEWMLPDRGMDKPIGYPTMLLLRQDGTIAGRFSGSYVTTDTTTVPSTQYFDMAINMRGLYELLELARDPREVDEERNNYPQWTSETLGLRDTREASLRAADLRDIYAIEAQAGLQRTFRVSGTEAVNIEVALLDVSGAVLATKNGALPADLDITTTDGAVRYVRVSASGDAVRADTPLSTVRYYEISADFSLVALEAQQQLALEPFVEGGNFETTLKTEAGRKYRLVATGGNLSFPEGGMEDLGAGFYRALAGGVVPLKVEVTASEAYLAWQLWVPGKVGFAVANGEVSERKTNAAIVVTRSEGASGIAVVRVRLDGSKTTATDGEDFVDIFGDDGLEVVWQDGERGDRVIDLPLLPDWIFEGDEFVGLTLEVVDGEAVLAAGGTEFLLKIVDFKPVEGDEPFFEELYVTFDVPLRVAVNYQLPLQQVEGGRVTINRLSGKLPSGVKVKYDATLNAAIISGVPGKVGSYSAVMQVAEQRGGKRVKGGTVELQFNVGSLAEYNLVAAQALSAEGAAIDPSSGRVVGVLTYTLSKTGRISAKYRGDSGKVSFKSKSWDSIDEAGSVYSRSESRGGELQARLTKSGQLEAELWVSGVGAPLLVKLNIVPWSVANPALRYAGYYTAGMSPVAISNPLAPLGYSYMTLSLQGAALRSGKVKYAGMLANGTKVSGSGVLTPAVAAEEQGQVVLYVKKSKYALGAVMAVDADAALTYRENPSAVSACGEAVSTWSFNSGNAATSYTVELSVCGGYYSGADSLLEHWEAYEGLGAFQLLADAVEPESGQGVVESLPQVDLTTTATALKIDRAALNPNKAKLTLVRKSGVYRGSFKLPFRNPLNDRVTTVSAKYAGVLLPGWVGGCGCGDDEDELPEMPFGMGAYWFKEKVVLEPPASVRPVSATIIQGYPITIEKALD